MIMSRALSLSLSLSRLIFVFVFAVLVQCAPTNTNDTKASALIRQNALDAQLLNGEFQRMNESDACDSGQTACITNVPAQCKFGSWQLGRCPSSSELTSCFALPRANARGTFLACLTDPEAASFFQQAGVPGGPVITNTNSTSVVLPTTSSITPTPTPQRQDKTQSVVTVTVTVPSSPSTSTSTSTSTSISTSTSRVVTTLGAAEALGVLQSALANGAVVVSSSSSSSSSSSPSSPSTPTSTPSHSHSHSCTTSESTPPGPSALSLSTSSRYEPKRSLHSGVRSRRLRLGGFI